MLTDRAVKRLSSERVAMRPIMDRQTPVKTLPSLAVGNNKCVVTVEERHCVRNTDPLMCWYYVLCPCGIIHTGPDPATVSPTNLQTQPNPQPVADPGFPRGGGANSPGGANIRFCQIFPKTA